MRKDLRIASVGDNCVDIYVNAGNQARVGGNAVNTAVAVRRCGILCSYVGIVGEDANGSRVIKEVAEEGVDVTHVRREPGETAYTRILLEHNDRIPVGEDIGVQRNYGLTWEETAFVLEHDLVHLSAFTAWPTAYEGDIADYYGVMSGILQALSDGGARVSLDFSDTPMEELLGLVQGRVEVGFFSRSGLDEGQIEEEARRLMGYGFHLVVLTRGAEGSCAFDGEHFYFQPIVPVSVVDPLGAGDSFIGAFLSRYIEGEPVPACLSYGAGYASKVCGRMGGF